jgi:uncharacterized membrane protein
VVATAWVDVLIVAGAVGAGLFGGVLYAFSSFVMPALDRLPPDRAVQAMQTINRQATTAGLMSVMCGVAVIALVLAVEGFRELDVRRGRGLVIGSSSYLAAVAVTALFHVPRNQRLATLTTPHADVAQEWRSYSSAWSRANHARAALAIAASTAFAWTGIG